MKYLFITALIVGLASCDTNETECCITLTPTTDTTFLPDSIVVNNYLITDSIANVSDLLDTLAAYEPSVKMTH